MIEKALRAILIADADISAVVGGRLYPMHLPQNPVLPAITYEVVSDAATYSNDGDSGLNRPRFQIEACASTYAAAATLAKLVKKKLSAYKGSHGINGIFYINGTDAHETGYENLAVLYRRIMDFYIWYNE